MENNQVIIFVCAVIAVVGLLVQVFSSESLVTVDRLSPDLLGKEILLKGEITSKRVNDGHVFLSVNGFSAVIFERDAKRIRTPYFFLVGDHVVLRGKIVDYDGELELVAWEAWV
ncbi:hypothetical protein K8R43_00890 [archaeon]|nr:hypothetical protein [archaeon]